MRILVVEDEPRLLRNLCRALREEGYAVHSADNGPDGLAKTLDIAYDAVVLDVMLSGMDGWHALCRRGCRGGRRRGDGSAACAGTAPSSAARPARKKARMGSMIIQAGSFSRRGECGRSLRTAADATCALYQSTIGDRGRSGPREQSSAGVVRYQSAHLPQARRILRENAGD